jgi:TetR/AcrR family transcriptional regulator, transcriptional repressor of bet genes
MPKRGMGPIRRKQLVEAVIVSIHVDGYANATVARIARRAGVSSGIVHHYFSSKDELLFETMRSLLAELRRDAVERLRQAGSPEQRLGAVIDATFGDGQFSEQVFSAWLAFYGNARQSPQLRRLLELYQRRLRANLLHELKWLADGPRAAEIADVLGAMIDGLWLRYALLGRPRDPAIPRLLARRYLDAQLAGASSGGPEQARSGA